MSQQKDNNFWYNYFKSFQAYLKSEKYAINETAIEVIKIVDYKAKPVNNELLYSYININVAGNYYVKDDNTIYDESLNVVQVLTTGDAFTVDSIPYFINSELNVNENGNQWNNTLLGDNGISLVIGGGFNIDEQTDFSLWTAPQISIVFDKVLDVNALERTSTTRNKELNFDIDIFVKETNSMESIDSTGYDELNRVDSLLNTFIYDYFNTKKCAHDLGTISYKDHFYDLEKIGEERPTVLAIKTNRLTFR
ncbi:MAG: hypothetical protein GY928_37500 [Colwellia sp.]|nr:hypothetical protein [Colwellia sp.]